MSCLSQKFKALIEIPLANSQVLQKMRSVRVTDSPSVTKQEEKHTCMQQTPSFFDMSADNRLVGVSWNGHHKFKFKFDVEEKSQH